MCIDFASFHLGSVSLRFASFACRVRRVSTVREVSQVSLPRHTLSRRSMRKSRGGGWR